MKAATATDRPRRRRGRRRHALVALLASVVLAGCGTGHPGPISASELAGAQTFPYYRIYWVGLRFAGYPLAAADGLNGYNNAVGDSVYYGDCVHGKGIFGGGSCLVPLQVTTVIYRLHSNSTLGPQYNILIRGVPATVYDEGRSVELYTGRVSVDIFSDTLAHALSAVAQLRPVNAPGSAAGDLPAPIYCPGLSGAINSRLRKALDALPGRVCQKTSAAEAFKHSLA